jgi:uncharacterized protein YbcV (DUF1398 family)
VFTSAQLKAAHSQVKSGADFPAYIQDIMKLGVTHYETFVTNGQTNYFGSNAYKVTSDPKYDPQLIAENSNHEQFKADLKAHQQGKSDFPTFCAQCAAAGIEKWVVSTEQMTCTYYDKAGNEVLVESIPH